MIASLVTFPSLLENHPRQPQDLQVHSKLCDRCSTVVPVQGLVVAHSVSPEVPMFGLQMQEEVEHTLDPAQGNDFATEVGHPLK